MLLRADHRSQIGLGIERVACTVRVASELDEARGEIAARFAVSTSSREPALHDSPAVRKMPLTAYVTARSRSSRSARKTCGDLPPHSRLTRFMFDWPAYSSIFLPVAVEPVNEIFATSRCSASGAPASSAEAVHDVEHAGGPAGLDEQLGEQQRRQRRILRGLQHDGIARSEGRRDLPRGHHERKIPRHDATDDARAARAACNGTRRRPWP